MAGEQLHRIFEFVTMAVQGPLAKIVNHDGGADRDRGDQDEATTNQPANGAAGKKGFQVERTGTVYRHGDRHPSRTLEQFPRTGLKYRYIDGMEVRLVIGVNCW